jgi:hypothetical protein
MSDPISEEIINEAPVYMRDLLRILTPPNRSDEWQAEIEKALGAIERLQRMSDPFRKGAFEAHKALAAADTAVRRADRYRNGE